jgi:hypothetical protein
MALMTTGAYEGSLFAEGVSVRFKASPFHEAASAADSVVFPGFELHSLHRMERGAAWVWRRPDPLGPREVDDRDIRGSIALSPWEEDAHASRLRFRRAHEDLRSSTDPPKRSSWRETTVYLGSSQEASRRAPELDRSKSREHTRCGFSSRQSGWQKSVRDILAGNALRESGWKRACLARRKPLPGIDAVGERGERANRCCSAALSG